MYMPNGTSHGTCRKASTSSTKSAVEVLREWVQMVEVLSDDPQAAWKDDADHRENVQLMSHLYGCAAIVEQLGRIADELEEANTEIGFLAGFLRRKQEDG
jgi:hypothetical protein